MQSYPSSGQLKSKLIEFEQTVTQMIARTKPDFDQEEI